MRTYSDIFFSAMLVVAGFPYQRPPALAQKPSFSFSFLFLIITSSSCTSRPRDLVYLSLTKPHLNTRGKGTLVMSDVDVSIAGHRAEWRREDCRDKRGSLLSPPVCFFFTLFPPSQPSKKPEDQHTSLPSALCTRQLQQD